MVVKMKQHGLTFRTPTGIVWIDTTHLHSIELGVGENEYNHPMYELRVEWYIGGALMPKKYILTSDSVEHIQRYIHERTTIPTVDHQTSD